MRIHLNPKDALIVVDVQVDFLPGGALAVANGEQVIRPLNCYIDLFSQRGLPVFFTRDWHCRNHCSFKENGGQWPLHCESDTPGALFASELLLPTDNRYIISKGVQPEVDAYSGFQGTSLLGLLREKGITRVFIGGIATEYCVKATVLDALKLGFVTALLTDAIRGIDANSADQEMAVGQMLEGGALALTIDDF
ncbi:isochorismatase family protein [bacterium]|nr:isochorismatase family protein [bacterium]